ncbi:MAG: hypothetical protein IJ795_00590 [Bacteroidales bacterium]|nr:hypothetical protein [Bacteroidales bacterium]
MFNKKALLIISGIAAIAVACQKGGLQPSDTASEDPDAFLAGTTVTVGEKSSTFTKLFLLNEGAYQANNCTIDFFRFSSNTWYSDIFQKTNPDAALGLGDTGNDIAVYDGRVWTVLNGSGAVVVLDAKSEKKLAAIAVPAPRNIAFLDGMAFVTSYEGAIWGGEAVKGKVYAIDCISYEVEGSVEVGCQPEGIAACGGKLYVANSGGYQAAGYENSISVIDPGTMKVESSIEVADNLHQVVSDRNGNLWATTYGIGEYDESFNYSQTIPCNLYRVNTDTRKATLVENVHASLITPAAEGGILALGNEEELSGACSWAISNVSADGSLRGAKTILPTEGYENAYGIICDPSTGYIYVGFTDYSTPGRVECMEPGGKEIWHVTTGINPGHFALY